MKNEELEYLDKLFAKSSDQVEESEVDLPLVDVPANLTDRLYAITEPALGNPHSVKEWSFKSWPKVASIAASLLVAVVFIQMYQQQQTLKQLEQAQTDLTTALHYLAEANKITQAQMIYSLNANMRKAAVEPVIKMGRDAVFPSQKSPESETKVPTRTL